jgi:maleate isomerase
MRRKLEDAGCRIVGFASFLEQDDRVVAKISERSILAAIKATAEKCDCDVVIVSCTNLRVAGVVEKAEEMIGCPVISSNTALAWNMLRLAGVDTRRLGFGQLFNVELTASRKIENA